MKTMLHACSVTVSVALLSGCVSTHPLPDDVTDSTVSIVVKVRCEARDAVISAIRTFIDKNGTESDLKYLSGLMRGKFGDVLYARRGVDLSDDVWDYLSKYYNGAIAYDFELDMTSSTQNGVGFTFFNIYRHYRVDYDIGGSVGQTNQAKRVFRLTDTVSDLFQIPKADCVSRKRKPTLYPISGTIGMKEIVSTYVALYDMDAFEREGDESKKKQFSQELTFSTTIKGKLDPKITVGASDPAITFANSAERVDKHKLTVAINVAAPTLKFSRDEKGSLVKGPATRTSLYSKADTEKAINGAVETLDDRRYEYRYDVLKLLGDGLSTSR